MLLHVTRRITDADGMEVMLRVPIDSGYYTRLQRIEQDKQVALLSGPCRTRYAGKDEIEQMLRRA
jgi:hypothetical protein